MNKVDPPFEKAFATLPSQENYHVSYLFYRLVVVLLVYVTVNGSSRRTRESLIDISLLARKHERAYLHHIGIFRPGNE